MGREELVAVRRESLLAVVPYSSVRRFDVTAVGQWFVTERWMNFGQLSNQLVFLAGEPRQSIEFLYSALEWDSQYFRFQAARLQAVLFESQTGAEALTRAVNQFKSVLRSAGTHHCYTEATAVGPRLLYALGKAGWSMVETRLHYHHTDLQNLADFRYAVRPAGEADVESVRMVSACNRNSFDRFHADPVFTPAQGNDFLGE